MRQSQDMFVAWLLECGHSSRSSNVASGVEGRWWSGPVIGSDPTPGHTFGSAPVGSSADGRDVVLGCFVGAVEAESRV